MVRRFEAPAFADGPWFQRLKYGAGTAAAAAVAIVALGGCWGDFQVERDLKRRGVTVQGHLLKTWCGKCSMLPVEFTTTSGTVVHADLPVAGEPDDDSVLVRYDPQHPTHVHASNGVVYDEVVSGLVGAGAAAAFAYALFSFPRARRGARFAGSPLTAGSTGSVPPSHVRVLKS